MRSDTQDESHSKRRRAYAIRVLFLLLFMLTGSSTVPCLADKPVDQPQFDFSPHVEAFIDKVWKTDLLVEAIVQIESSGNPMCVGKAGERGLMQIKRGTWRETTGWLFGRYVHFDRAFEPKLNRRVGRAYLANLQIFLYEHRDEWRSDERSLLLACYNSGPTRVMQNGFRVSRLPEKNRDYVQRVSDMHDYYIAQGRQLTEDIQLSRAMSR